ncbi:MAG: hypothetical protein WAX04_03500, partial [Oscillospiraceae bacterium]
MKLFKRILALAMVMSMTLSLAACADTSWVYDYNGKKISSGAYIAFTLEAYANAQSHKDINKEVTDIFKQTLDGKQAKQWMIDETKKLSNHFMAVENKFDELGLTLTEKDQNEIDQSVKLGWEQYKTLYTNNSVSEKTYKTMIANTKKQSLIFDKYYGTGGIEAVPNDKLLVHFKDNFASVNIFGMPTVQPLEDKLTEEDKKKNEELKAKADEYAKLFNEGKKTVNEIYDMYKHYDAETEHDAKNAEDKIGKDEETKKYIKKDSTNPSEKVVKAIYGEMKDDGVAKVIADDQAYYIVVRYDVTKDESNFEDMKKSVLADVKGEDFNKMVEGWATEIKSTANNAAIKRYNPKK